MTECRYLLDPPSDGAWNMAVDELLLEWSAARRACGLRFYQWREPTVSLGYFQGYSDRANHAASASCALVRRETGGGAIVHDDELTYSLVVPADHPLAAQPRDLYAGVHGALVEALGGWGIQAALCGCEACGDRPRQPFLCFLRRAAGDVLVGPFKIAGSAQRRRRGAILQHGSVILRQSRAAPEVPGLAEAARVEINSAEFVEAWSARLAERLELRFREEPLSPEEITQVNRLAEEKYASVPWNQKR
ncbi:MAG: lipoate--protein ligase family protein [Pirellulales bacterium]